MGFFKSITKAFKPLALGVADTYTGGFASKIAGAAKTAQRRSIAQQTPVSQNVKASSSGAQLMGGGGEVYRNTSSGAGDISPNAADAYVNFMESYFQSAGYTPLIAKAWRKAAASGAKKDGFVLWLSSRQGDPYTEALKIAIINDLEATVWKVKRRRSGGLTRGQRRALKTVAAIKRMVSMAQSAPRLKKKKRGF